MWKDGALCFLCLPPQPAATLIQMHKIPHNTFRIAKSSTNVILSELYSYSKIRANLDRRLFCCESVVFGCRTKQLLLNYATHSVEILSPFISPYTLQSAVASFVLQDTPLPHIVAVDWTES